VSAIGGMNMGAEAESEHIRLVCIGNNDDFAPVHVQKWLETQPLDDIDIIVHFETDLSNGLMMLDNGEVDLIAISARAWYSSKRPGFAVVATAIPRRDENHILVADDRPHHLPHKSIILAENRLQRRQLRRYRSDFRVLDPMAFADMANLTPNTDSKLEFQSWMEDLRATKIITGYVTERHLFSIANVDARRHMLQTNSREGATRFIPSPFQGLTLLVSREGFPKSLSDQIGDSESMTAWNCEQIILDQIKPELRDRVGLLVRHRQIPSLLNQADEEKDLLRSTSLLDGEGDIIDNTSMVEILLEVVGKTGEKTLLLEKLVSIDDASTHARLMVAEWNSMLKIVTMEHAEDIRLGPARPAFLDL
jgi:hypothetical protein|tara:strand:+ start:326 stop:1417 length:1092 start_codon:yes stop_codon:yes gene_type:complete